MSKKKKFVEDHHRWTETEITELEELADADATMGDAAITLGLPEGEIVLKATELGISLWPSDAGIDFGLIADDELEGETTIGTEDPAGRGGVGSSGAGLSMSEGGYGNDSVSPVRKHRKGGPSYGGGSDDSDSNRSNGPLGISGASGEG